MGLYLSTEEVSVPTNRAEAQCSVRTASTAKFFHAMLERGVAFAPGAYEILFVSLAHRKSDLDAHR